MHTQIQVNKTELSKQGFLQELKLFGGDYVQINEAMEAKY
jgi:hypothetical protein